MTTARPPLPPRSSRRPQHTKSPPLPRRRRRTADLGADVRTDRRPGRRGGSRPRRARCVTIAPAGVDFSGQPVTFVAPNMVDGVAETCWRTPGDATGMVLTFRLERPTTITKVGLINGYAKTAFSGGRRYDWYQGDRRVLSVDWIFDDGTTVSQHVQADPGAMQSRNDRAGMKTSTVQVRITAVTPPGTRAGRRATTPGDQRGGAGRQGSDRPLPPGGPDPCPLTVRGAPARRQRPSRPRRSRRGGA